MPGNLGFEDNPYGYAFSVQHGRRENSFDSMTNGMSEVNEIA